MSGLIAVALAALLVSVLLYRAARGPNFPIKSVEDVVRQTYPVDVEAFLTLSDPDNDAYLAKCLTRVELKKYRSRTRALQREYLQQMARNCAVLMRLAEAARENPELAPAATQLIDFALNCRLQAIKGILVLYLGEFLHWTPAAVTAGYRDVRSGFADYCLRGCPEAASRVMQVV